MAAASDTMGSPLVAPQVGFICRCHAEPRSAPEDVLRAVSATGALFAELARDVACRTGFTYTEAAEQAF
ncbi:hypothetical protein NLX83_28580 [Allokutzneria sp. A3M-2-11 16]|uniref:hypothetical protein n=1 Tax=Allokutzneria sp. A3M-2-11 16 TaxID=2962043 RepID=UPI0020B7D544|nr:hypothetical protein [Allokutzneria sp. A3M-2-11 16]MCP3803241.1 hypothetical protein [Allokutzneria sp. A3M-2-11 16]